MPSFSPYPEVIPQIRLLVLDFDGVLTDNAVYVSQDGTEMVRCWRSDGLGLAQLPGIGIDVLVVSMEVNPVVSARCRKLKLTCVQGVEDKVAKLGEILIERGLEWRDVAYMGNDINDEGCLKRAALPIVPEDAHRAVIPLALWRTDARGGYGAVREVCDEMIRVREK